MEPNTLNRCNLPPWVIASRHFDESPRDIELQGVRQANRFLFERLDGIAEAEHRARCFDDWMAVRFQLHAWRSQSTEGARRALRNSYLRFLRGWGMDASSVEGAVLKGWVESRLGIPPAWHHGPITSSDSPAWERYLRDRTRGHAYTSAIHDQLDLVYTWTQYELGRRRPGERQLTLWRGQHDAELGVVERLGRYEAVLRLNNISSFTDDPERAWEFGTTVWEARLATARVFYAGGLLPASVLRGEGEWLVIGGEVRARRRRA